MQHISSQITPLPWADFGNMAHRFYLYRDIKDCFLAVLISVSGEVTDSTMSLFIVQTVQMKEIKGEK